MYLGFPNCLTTYRQMVSWGVETLIYSQDCKAWCSICMSLHFKRYVHNRNQTHRVKHLISEQISNLRPFKKTCSNSQGRSPNGRHKCISNSDLYAHSVRCVVCSTNLDKVVIIYLG